MPNWVYSELTIESDDTEAIAAIKAKLAQPYETHHPKTEYDADKGKWVQVPNTQTNNEALSFWNIIAPTDLDTYYKRKDTKPREGGFDLEAITKEIDEGFREGMDWYNWNVRNWGSKWDACEVVLESEANNRLYYRFSTAWAPPLPAIYTLADQHPDLRITLSFEEEQGWGGEVTLYQGEEIGRREWDIPSSHADYENLERECMGCVTPWKNDAGEWQGLDSLFSDCPRDFLTEE